MFRMYHSFSIFQPRLTRGYLTISMNYFHVFPKAGELHTLVYPHVCCLNPIFSSQTFSRETLQKKNMMGS